MRIYPVTQAWPEIEADVLIVPLFKDRPISENLGKLLNNRLKSCLQELKHNGEWSGKTGEIVEMFQPDGLQVGRLLLAGLGTTTDADLGTVRMAVARAVRRLAKSDTKRIMAYAPDKPSPTIAIQAVVGGVVLGTFKPGQYKTQEKSKFHPEALGILQETPVASELFEDLAMECQVLGRSVNLARSLVGEPGNVIDPPRFADKAVEIARSTGLQVQILDEAAVRQLGLSAVLAVAQGSRKEPRLIILKHLGAPDRNQPPVAFIGKGVTFDSGGISLKPSASMEEMKADKAGACAVLASMQAIAQLQIPRNVVAIIPAVENLPGGRAQRPGDVIRSYSGKTIEVINTDAEGRLILADAIAYCRKEFAPEYIVDIATLTGACVIALGHLRAGLFSNHETLLNLFNAAAVKGGERYWQLPLDPEYRKELDSTIADIMNAGSRWGGAILAAKFLEEFVEDTPWCHIDMAGVDLFHGDDDKGIPTGFGVFTLVEIARSVVLDRRW